MHFIRILLIFIIFIKKNFQMSLAKSTDDTELLYTTRINIEEVF